MPRLNLRNKLLLALLTVLVPMLALILFDYTLNYQQTTDNVLNQQANTAQAIGVLVDASIDDALAIAWSLGKDPTIQSLDTGEIDPYLISLAPELPQLDDLAVFDANGNNVASAKHLPTLAMPRPGIADRAYFTAIKSTGQPQISDVLISQQTGDPIIAAAVPMTNDAGSLTGVIVAALNMNHLANRVKAVSLLKSQNIFLVDSKGTIAFHTGLAPAEWGHTSYANFAPVRSALHGTNARVRSMMTPMGDIRIVAATRANEYGMVVGVSVSQNEILQPIIDNLWRQLAFFAAVWIITGLLAVALSRHMIIRPLGVLVNHFDAIRRGEWDRRVEMRTGDEMEQLADACNRMTAEVQFRQQEREKFVHTVSHDLRAPLTIIRGHAQIVQHALEQRGAEHALQLSAQAIVTSTLRMNAMIQDLVDSARMDSGSLRLEKMAIDLRSFVAELLERSRMIIDAQRIDLEIPPDLPKIDADPNRLERIVTNLTTNALKYSPADRRVAINAERVGHEVMVSIADRGVGIAKEDLPQIFERFYEPKAGRRAEGLGLGLYITKMFVEAHGGRIWVESEPSQGSTFYFTLALA